MPRTPSFSRKDTAYFFVQEGYFVNAKEKGYKFMIHTVKCISLMKILKIDVVSNEVSNEA